ncbi:MULTISPECIES: hypothetical protein [Streptomyces]|uniref:Regulatory protein n=3 Tax=Streptomyces TaxID=1883 RepID=M3DFN2_STREZ|nr:MULTISPECIES: hypothetical protein [Streptomyces pseudogriseolus group]EMF20457.1 regulatory protein [Streptomyces gancidicus BKS 13-15]GGS66468.1 hypothetical protein GCM10010285_52150 [Streptomyces rubiginosus]
MSDHSTVATDLTSQYVAQVANDLERNAKEQERVGAEIAELQGQLAALRRDRALLVKMQQALELAAAPAVAADDTEDASTADVTEEAGDAGDAGATEAAAVGEPPAVTETSEETSVSGRATVPAPRSRGGVRSGARKPKRERKKVTAGGAAKSRPASSTKTAGASKPGGPAKAAGAKAARKPATSASESAGKASAEKASAAKAPRKAPAKAAQPDRGDAPKLVDLVRGHLAEQKEPRSAAEIAAALDQAHPGRAVKVTVIRSTLEGLVARNQAQRSKQGTSVFYTAPEGGTPAPESAADARS